MKRNSPRLISKRHKLSLVAALSSALAWSMQDPLLPAEKAFNKGSYSETIQIIERLPTADGARCEARFLTGVSWYRLQRLEKALPELEAAAECDPGEVKFRVALAEAYVEKREDNKALLALESVLKIEPQNKTALSEVSSIYLRHEMNEQAISTLEKLVAMEPRNVQARSDLGAAYAGALNFNKAQSNFEQALKLDPKNASALVGLGHVEIKLEQPERAAAILTRAVAAAPGAYEPYYLRGIALSASGKSRQALDDMEAALRLGGGQDPEIYYHLAQVDRALGQEEDARRALFRFSELKAESNRTNDAKREAAQLTEQARKLVDEEKLTDAIALLEKALQLAGDTPQTLFRLASLYYDTRQFEPAEHYDEKAISMDPSEWTYYYLRGLIGRDRQDPDKARDSFETAVRLNPRAAEVVNQLGELSAAQGKYSDAVQKFEKAASLDPREPAYQANLEKARRAVQR